VAVTTWLMDKSAYGRLAESADAQVWIDRIERGMVRISTVTRLEIGYSFRTAAQARTESVSPPLAPD
jgi:predicted nucleic acid-binding protein